MNEKVIFSMFVIGVVAFLQGVAWYLGFNGTVYAFTSLIIGAVAGSILGFSLNGRNKGGSPPPEIPNPSVSTKKQG